MAATFNASSMRGKNHLTLRSAYAHAAYAHAAYAHAAFAYAAYAPAAFTSRETGWYQQ